MSKYNILILTDHLAHNAENSVYELAKYIRLHPKCQKVHIASRSHPSNDAFFQKLRSEQFQVTPVSEDFYYQPSQAQFLENTCPSSLNDYDALLLRLPHPVAPGFFRFLERKYRDKPIINHPRGVKKTGNKSFLLEIAQFCPPVKLCWTLEDILEFYQYFPIVLKPLESHGGKGIIKLEENKLFTADQEFPLESELSKLEKHVKENGYLAMKYLPDVYLGDKRTVVVNGKIIGSALRIPPKGAWLCNAAQGGHAQFAAPDKDERQIISQLTPLLMKKGIVMYGMDTLVNEKGKRVLSEINTLSIGGIKQMADFSGKPLVKKTADLLMSYIDQYIKRMSHVHRTATSKSH
ncbi:MAG TPA: glutathione synthetase [Saprospiraceae bacterium]|nr:glutathione synthetase [Saprospiraceae bacterium]HMQ81873.1 glutathione synthetase [Saprospiraceae bacterium]